MITACSGIARPIRNMLFVQRSQRLPMPRMIAYAAMNEMITAGITAPAVTMTLLRKYLDDLAVDDRLVVLERRMARRGERVGDEVVRLGLEARDDDPVDRDHHDEQPNPSKGAAGPVHLQQLAWQLADSAGLPRRLARRRVGDFDRRRHIRPLPTCSRRRGRRGGAATERGASRPGPGSWRSRWPGP